MLFFLSIFSAVSAIRIFSLIHIINMERMNKIGRYHARIFGNPGSMPADTETHKILDKLVREITLYCNEEADLPQVMRFLKRLRYNTGIKAATSGESQGMASYLVHIIDTELEVMELKLNHSEYRIAIPKRLKWTHTYVALVELVYAIQSSLNRGKAQLQEIVAAFEFIFQVKLGNYSATLEEIASRKRKPSGYFDLLKKNLQEIVRRYN
ncbi:RteC domain-containing protein [Dysgonomonas sp. GY75]|uniref:RteC domain-containing protein n=1 Tax=Dysgonomonas sp. GY75 TaxID=2780419 RepID=UPI0018834241|nr:RteC domain-containing protein [Dysgonomonas sp. GY75]MBF0650791.1 RteC domain-containing protein [Dysgonomonas sp. GY75]